MREEKDEGGSRMLFFGPRLGRALASTSRRRLPDNDEEVVGLHGRIDRGHDLLHLAVPRCPHDRLHLHGLQDHERRTGAHRGAELRLRHRPGRQDVRALHAAP